MKKLIILVLIGILAIPFYSTAQQRRGGNRDEIEKTRKNVYARVLVLTDDEAAKFWPVFDKMQQEMEVVKMEQNKIRKAMRDNYATLSDTDLDKNVQEMMNQEQKALDIKKKYYPEFKKVLPMKKVALLPRAEREFKRELLGKIKQLPDDGE